MSDSTVTTVIWDFDGTLADTVERNLEITRKILSGEAGPRATAACLNAAAALVVASSWYMAMVGLLVALAWARGFADVYHRLDRRRRETARDNLRRTGIAGDEVAEDLGVVGERLRTGAHTGETGECPIQGLFR